MLAMSKSLLKKEKWAFHAKDNLRNQVKYLLSNNQLLLNTHSLLLGILLDTVLLLLLLFLTTNTNADQ